ncbi:bromodomain and PHD finger-containing protein 3 isoform X3 [Archocentrus centrarchus]|nr:bromodomain and PHD finger-containing protein 3-like isoform X3 [Archocentrus centrarchus]XP_030589643.1 bromodomain and PHD finger-containing protein 3-like isoform X3 [Archocentrus centrarchus]XP_030589644.1 bromodomain and PHD finger-containing protein 3-like isoform X3 [Archocentrus centrarchus]XP_030589645.1 bromodomain and PHD finger-containing protein 3-like isoform X3 [Archocentrus centrarchus]XP_030589646.1 bromodomain and PHD finger-containing protein 3-like isoform X3 [Archocentru
MRKPRRKGQVAGGGGGDVKKSSGTVGGRGAARQRSPSPYSLKASPSRETLTYAQAQKVVEVELDGRLHRISILEPLEVITEDEMMAQDISECNSNKENSEQSSPPASSAQTARKPATPRSRRKDPKSSTNKSPPSSKNSCPNSHSPSLEKLNKSQHHLMTLPEPKFRVLETFTPVEAPPLPAAYYRYIETSAEEEAEAEYDMDEEDTAWLEMVNVDRTSEGYSAVLPETFERLLDRLEEEAYLEARSRAPPQSTIDDDAFCCVCLDDECLNSNVILFCDSCNLAVHQECYGVPYIPEGQWLCRCCLQSPQKPVDCVLCPNRGGAFKQTSDGRWAHVVCAIWIPEVCFANTVFLEPVEGVSNIPPARWKLTCYLCKQKGRGASIQCHKANCYTAFHVTCAQRAGLFMKIEPVRETNINGTTFSVKKTAFCEAHSPPGQETGSDDESEGRVVGSRGRASRGRSAYTEGPTTPKKGRKSDSDAKTDKKKGKRNTESPSRRTASPQVTVPQIPTSRLNIICKGITLQKKNQFMQRLYKYWLLKRQSRNGVPLVRRLHSNIQTQRNTEQPEVDEKISAAREALRYWQKLRHDLEKARLLVELIRKREKLKREQVKVHQAALEMQLTPMLVLLRSTLDQLQEKDTAQIFAQPVDIKEVPDYLEFISNPIDFSTMRSKLESHSYRSVADLEADFNLMVSNCLLYNSKDTVFHRAALRLRDLGGAILRHAQRQATNTGLDLDTGMHLPESPQKRDFYSCTWEDVDSVLDPENRLHMSMEEQLKELLEKLDFVTSMRCSGARTRRIRLLRREINNIRAGRHGQSNRHSLHNGHLKEDDENDQDEEDNDKDAKADNGLMSSDKEDLKSTSPPTLEPTGPAPPPRQGDAPLEPPTLRPITGEPQSHSYPCKRLKMDGDLSNSATENVHCTSAQGRSASSPPTLHSEGQALTNGLPELGVSPRPTTGGVGRRTSVLFKKAKNGAKLFKARDNPLLNGKGPQDENTSNNSSALNSTDITQSSTPCRTLQKSPGPPNLNELWTSSRDLCSDSETEKTPNHTLESGLTNGFNLHKDGGSDLEFSSCPVLHKEINLPPKRSLGKPALSKVPFLDIVNGDSDYTGNSSQTSEDEMELEPLDLVWAKCRGYPSYPALIIDPEMPEEGLLHNGVPIPVPPKDVLHLGEQRQEETNEKLYLVLFFDNKRTWQWLPRDKVTPLGVDDTADKLRIMEGRKSSIRKSVQVAYDRAMIHQSRVSHSHGFVASSYL